MKNSEIPEALFLQAVQALDSGNMAVLKQLLESHPLLATGRLDTPGDKGYFKDPYLLWFVADNPIRHEKLPPNIVEEAGVIIDAMKKAGSDRYPFILGYALGLVSTGRIPRECQAQIPLMELLIKEGANPRGSVLGAIGQHNFEAAIFLLDKGADYNLAAAVGLRRNDDVKKLIKESTAADRYVALVVASFFGSAGLISSLLEAGADPNGKVNPDDFGGFHGHASPMHQAVSSGSLEAVAILSRAGARRDARDSIHQATPEEWAHYFLVEEATTAEQKKNFAEIESFLRDDEA
ncbi:MAG TPA: hypothetical protein VKR53_01150 [Puia sp.]|nr:hypothetical protein [Puia sp.]